MPSHLDYLVETIGVVALNYINGKRTDSGESEIAYPDLLTKKTAEEISSFTNRIIDEVCGQRKEKDKTGRRSHLEYMFAVYGYCRDKLNQAHKLNDKDWQEFSDVLLNYLTTCHGLMTSVRHITFDGVSYELRAFTYQTKTAYLANSLGDNVGNFGSKVKDFIFQRLQPPETRPYVLQVLDMVTNHQNMLLRRQISELVSRLQVLEDMPAQMLSLKQANQELVEQLARQQQEIQQLKSTQQQESARMRALNRFGLSNTPKKEAQSTLESSATSTASSFGAL